MTSDRHLNLMALMRDLDQPAAIYRRSVRLAASTETGNPINADAVKRGEAALDLIEQAVRAWTAKHPEPAAPPSGTPPTDQRTLCRTCVTPIAYIDAPTGGWWAHDAHPADEHDAVPGAWVNGDELMEEIAAAVWEHCGTEGTSLVVDDPRNIAGTAAAVARRFADAEQAELRHLRAPADRVRALAILEAADFLRDAHFRDGLTVQEIGTALRHTADEADPTVGSLARDGFGLDEIADMLAHPTAVPAAGVTGEGTA